MTRKVAINLVSRNVSHKTITAYKLVVTYTDGLDYFETERTITFFRGTFPPGKTWWCYTINAKHYGWTIYGIYVLKVRFADDSLWPPVKVPLPGSP